MVVVEPALELEGKLAWFRLDTTMDLVEEGLGARYFVRDLDSSGKGLGLVSFELKALSKTSDLNRFFVLFGFIGELEVKAIDFGDLVRSWLKVRSCKSRRASGLPSWRDLFAGTEDGVLVGGVFRFCWTVRYAGGKALRLNLATARGQ